MLACTALAVLVNNLGFNMLDLSLVKLIVNASVIVQLVMVVLLIMSLYSWTLIFRKTLSLRRAYLYANNFEETFWKGKDLSSLYNQLNKQADTQVGMSSIFSAGYVEFAKLRKQSSMTPDAITEGTQRAMRSALNKEIDRLDDSLATLATIGSVSPYIGLFGTVWGIMNSFHALGGMQQVTLAMVAPGISEALIATAMGLFAAIPAVIAYNNYADRIDKLVTRYETFLADFTSVLQRQAHVLAITNQSKAKTN